MFSSLIRRVAVTKMTQLTSVNSTCYSSCLKCKRNLSLSHTLCSRVRKETQHNDSKFGPSENENLGKIVILDPDEVEPFDELQEITDVDGKQNDGGEEPGEVKEMYESLAQSEGLDNKEKGHRKKKYNISKRNKNLGKIVTLNPDEVVEVNEDEIIDSNEESEEEIRKKYGTLPKFEKLGKTPQILNQAMMSVKTTKNREKNNLMLLEGKRLIQDALDSGQKLKMLFFTRVFDVQSFKVPSDAQCYKVLYKDLQFWSDVTTCQGVTAIFEKPDTSKQAAARDSIPLTIICDTIRDPGNMGSILRIAAGVGCKQLILLKGCVDIWEPKVLRSGAGAHFRLPIVTGRSWEEVESEMDQYSLVCLADSDAPIEKSNMELISEVEDGKTSYYEIDEVGNKVLSETIKDVPEKRMNVYQNRGIMHRDNIPLSPYYSVEYKSNYSVYLIVGGETHGLSSQAYQLGEKRKGSRVYIPLTNGVESLNSGVAVAVISYEMRRQFEINYKDQTECASSRSSAPSDEAYRGIGIYSE